MVMGQFVTTYRKDYLWPYVKTLGLRPEPDHIFQPKYRDDKYCACHCLPETHPTSEQRTIFGPEAYSGEQWSRLGPMGPLLDPKLFPAKVSAAPESKIGRYNQPNAFMVKLQEKYPFIYECLRTAPPGDIIARINRDRLATTYQVDYCKKSEYPSAPYDELIRAAGVDGLAPCPQPVRLPGDLCRPIQKSMITKRGAGGGAGGSGGRWGAAGGRSEDAKQIGKQSQFRNITPDLTCPKVPPGPYYSPYETKSSFKSDKYEVPEENIKKKHNCIGTSITSEITSWNPYSEEPLSTKDIINKWGKMSYRDLLHCHGGNYYPRPKF